MKHCIDSQVKYTAVTLACLLTALFILLGSAFTASADFTGAPNASGGRTTNLNLNEGGSMPPSGTSLASTPLAILTSILPNGVVGTPYYNTVAAGGGYGAYSFAVTDGALPDGLSLSAAGAISGTPTTASTYSFSIWVTDDELNTAGKTYSIIIYPGSSSTSSITISTPGLSSGIVGTYYSQKLSATGGSGVYSFTVSDGTLPDGLSLSTAGVISGIPTAASTRSFTVRATDTQSQTGTKTYSIPIGLTSSSITMSPSSLPDGTVGTYYSRTLAATGGSGSYTWTLSGGSLPDGLSLSASGVISGTPTYASTFSAAILVTDSSSLGATRTYSITIASATSPTSTGTTPSPATSPTTPSSSSSTPTVSGTSNTSTPDVSYSDLTIDPETANAGSPVTITLRVVNGGSSTISKSIALNVNGVDETQQTVELAPGKSQVVTFNLTKSNVGAYNIKVGTLSSSFQVKSGASSSKESSGPPWLLIGGGVLAVIVAAVVIRVLVMKSKGDL